MDQPTKYQAPAPWAVDLDSVGKQWTDSVSIADANGGHVAHLTRGYEGDANGEGCPSWINARLIAASPEMLVELKWMLNKLIDAHNVCYGGCDLSDFERIDRVIAKATGRS